MKDGNTRIIRTPGPYSTLPNHVVKNPNLSWKAKGILLYITNRPDGWELNYTDFINRSTDGKSSVQSGLKELQEEGYLEIHRNRGKKGKYTHTEWVISLNKPEVENLHEDNRPYSNKEVSNREPNGSSKKEQQKKIVEYLKNTNLDRKTCWAMAGKWLNDYSYESTIAALKEINSKDKWSMLNERDKGGIIGYIVEVIKNAESYGQQSEEELMIENKRRALGLD